VAVSRWVGPGSDFAEEPVSGCEPVTQASSRSLLSSPTYVAESASTICSDLPPSATGAADDKPSIPIVRNADSGAVVELCTCGRVPAADGPAAAHRAIDNVDGIVYLPETGLDGHSRGGAALGPTPMSEEAGCS
jgi:hypothetical protein